MRVLIFGSSGTLGESIFQFFEANDWDVVGTSRQIGNEETVKIDADFEKHIKKFGTFDAIVFAQGKNINDSINDTSDLHEILEANVTFISSMVEKLLRSGVFKTKVRITIIGSIWQDISKVNKFSYSVSKAALHGMMNSMVADLSPSGISINIVAPGVIDTPMTRANLTSDQIRRIISETPTGNLVAVRDVASLVYWLSCSFSDGINGQTIKIDNGWSNVRII